MGVSTINEVSEGNNKEARIGYSVGSTLIVD
jgi:hypothetical protein